MLHGMPNFADLAALNAWLEQRCVELWRETAHGSLPGTIADIWAEELPLERHWTERQWQCRTDAAAASF
jgi:hypothetical protein